MPRLIDIFANAQVRGDEARTAAADLPFEAAATSPNQDDSFEFAFNELDLNGDVPPPLIPPRGARRG